MIQLSPYSERVVDRINMIAMWIAVAVCIRNFLVCLRQYRRTRGKIHIVNMTQVAVFFVHRLIFGLIPLFELSACAIFPLLISLWHIVYLLFYTVMFMRLIILESDRHSLWIKVVGIALILVRFADWPYELWLHSTYQHELELKQAEGISCWAEWNDVVIILNFVGDALANLFLSGMFVRRLYLHILMSRTLMHRQNRIIEHIARKSLICLILTFVVNLAMNLLKATRFIGDRSDAFTVWFALVESTLLVEALRVDHEHLPNQVFCENCGMAIQYRNSKYDPQHQSSLDFIHMSKNSKRKSTIDPTLRPAPQPDPNNVLSTVDPATSQPSPRNMVSPTVEIRDTASAPVFALTDRPTSPTRATIPVRDALNGLNRNDPTASFSSIERSRPLAYRPEWSNNEFRMF